MLTYAIGDIHGCADLLGTLLERIAAHAADEPYNLVFLGDYIDRGPDSAAVLRTISRLHWSDPERVVCLMGNHEAMLLSALSTPGMDAVWLRNGGAETLASFGVEEAAAIPGDVLDWIEALATIHADAARWYVHAGFRPGSDPASSDPQDRLWIREPFLAEDWDFGRHVVHGHTPQTNGRPELRPFRTNLDTGAVYGGALTAGVFSDAKGPPSDVLQVRAG